MNISTKRPVVPGRNRPGSLVAGVIFLLLSGAMLLAAPAQAQATYYWRGASSGAVWTAATSWCTSATATVTPVNRRETPHFGDVLIFSGGSPNVTVDIDNQSVTRLKFINNTKAKLSIISTGSTVRNITVAGDATDEDLIISSGSTVTVTGTGTSSTTTLNTANLNFIMGASATASIAGDVTFTSSSGGTKTVITHQFQGPTAGAVRFTNGGSLTTDGTKFDGVPFGATAGLAVFATGSTFEQQAGDDPYGPAAFEAGSTFTFVDGTFGPLTAARTYGNLDFQNQNPVTLAGAFGLNILNNLSKTQSANKTVNINLTGAGTTVGGNLLVKDGGQLNFVPPTASLLNVAGTTTVSNGTLAFSPAVTGTATFSGNVTVNENSTLTFGGAVANVNLLRNLKNDETLNFAQTSPSLVSFAGTTAQSISGDKSPNFGDNAVLEINNLAGLTLLRSVTINRGLVLTQGLINTNRASNYLLTLPATATITGGSSTSYVSGYMARTTLANSAANANLLFPVGKGGYYRPITLNITAQDNAVTYTGEQQEAAAPQPSSGSGLTRASAKRYFQLAPNQNPAGFSATVTLTFGPNDLVTAPEDPTLVVAKNNALTINWTNIGHGTSTGAANGGQPVAGTLTSAPFTTFSPTTSVFALASTAPGGTGVNPLPVELTSFTATAKAAGIALDWATASEKNCDYFEVQRGPNGSEFQAIGRLRGQGSSATAHTYLLLDTRPLPGLAYYRLRQVDVDGTVTFSPVVTAKWVDKIDITAYPNPSTGIVMLPASSEALHYRVFNVQGQAVQSGEISDNALNFSRLSPGTYLLELTGRNGRSIQRVIHE